MSSSSEGSREIEAAKKRLAAAKARRTSASKAIDAASSMAASARKMAETARTMAEAAARNEEDARSELRTSQYEVGAAEEFLRQAEGRWEVIDVDALDSPRENEKPKKRKKTSSVGGNSAPAPLASRDNNANGGVFGRATVAGVSNDDDNGGVSQIVVEGSGVMEINGTYDRHPSGEMHHAPYFDKEGQWNGERGVFRIYRQSCFWYFGVFSLRGYPRAKFFRTMNRCVEENMKLPPRNGWITANQGTSPAPKLTW